MIADDGQYTAVLVIWTLLLVLVVLVLLPASLLAAARLVRSARRVDARLAATLKAATAIVDNTAPTRGLLDTTIRSASDVLATVRGIDQHAGATEGVLVRRAAGAKS
ncbi:MAG: hypothetical protein JF887_06930 [Candidatus Dormibacteraeota bacterium]|uniref:DUF948 domain-containing protein n=1 Tax=Candidatus Amunia macphersoniae TaxID=3127014 RepID=A0A934KI09_9BACT|nr:hypothetical protein [Candidatus Dormibacteraeota bacterium]